VRKRPADVITGELTQISRRREDQGLELAVGHAAVFDEDTLHAIEIGGRERLLQHVHDAVEPLQHLQIVLNRVEQQGVEQLCRSKTPGSDRGLAGVGLSTAATAPGERLWRTVTITIRSAPRGWPGRSGC
jgi:hypothetical protein